MVVFCLLRFDRVAAWSGTLGGLVYCVPNAVFAKVFFKEQRVGKAKHIVSLFYRAEAFKLLLSMGFFAIVFGFLQVIPAIFFAVYFLVQLTSWLTPWLLLAK